MRGGLVWEDTTSPTGKSVFLGTGGGVAEEDSLVVEGKYALDGRVGKSSLLLCTVSPMELSRRAAKVM